MVGKMRYIQMKISAAVCLALVLATSSVSAGGLADAIIEEQQVLAPPAATAPEATRGNTPNWVLPAIGLLVIGAIASGGSGSGGDSGSSSGGAGEPPAIIDVK